MARVMFVFDDIDCFLEAPLPADLVDGGISIRDGLDNYRQFHCDTYHGCFQTRLCCNLAHQNNVRGILALPVTVTTLTISKLSFPMTIRGMFFFVIVANNIVEIRHNQQNKVLY